MMKNKLFKSERGFRLRKALVIIFFLSIITFACYYAYTHKGKHGQEDNESLVDKQYQNWESYTDQAQNVSFRYPSNYTIDKNWIYDGIRIVAEDGYLVMHINEKPSFSKKVHEDNYKLISSNFSNRHIKKIEVYCTNQITESDTFCSSEETTSDDQDNKQKTLESIVYTQDVKKKGVYYFVGDFSDQRKNLAIEIHIKDQDDYSSLETFKNLELIVKSIEVK